MRKILFITISIIFAGCVKNEQRKLIESFVCTTDGITSDLSFKMIKLEEISPITATDSMIFFQSGYLPLKYTWNNDSLSFIYKDEDGTSVEKTITKSLIDSEIVFWVKQKSINETSLKEATTNLNDLEYKSTNHSYTYISLMTDLFESSINSSEESIRIIEGYLDTLALAKRYSKIDPDTILSRAFNCTYSIFNPVLKVKQTMTQTFYFDNDLSKVICSYLKK